MSGSDNAGIVGSVGALGINHAASNDRSYWNSPERYSDLQQLKRDWEEFVAQSQKRGNRRAMMRTIVTNEVFNQAAGNFLPLEAAIPVQKDWLIYLSVNEHLQISPDEGAVKLEERVQVELPKITLPSDYLISGVLNPGDVPNLFRLWKQFGWSRQGVERFVSDWFNKQTVVVRHRQTGKVVGVMIAEALQFGSIKLLEITEMAVLPDHQGKGLAKALIFYLTLSEMFKFAPVATLIYGEFCLSTNAQRAALAAGMIPAVTSMVDGILRDHVAIKSGSGNRHSNLAWENKVVAFFSGHVLAQGIATADVRPAYAVVVVEFRIDTFQFGWVLAVPNQGFCTLE